uniref:ComF family protein n=1 Tax=Fervidobacterium thailandense TaxID=1008305 RepID=A0A7C5RJB3_9BACT
MENPGKIKKLKPGTKRVDEFAFQVGKTEPFIDSFKAFLKASFTLLVACECLICGRPVSDANCDGGLRICETCWSEIEHKPSPVPYRIKNLEVFYYGFYEERLRDLVLAFKFGKHPGLSKVLAKFLMKVVHEHGIDYDFVTFVPATRTSRRKRGFDHMALVAREFSKVAGKEVFKLLKTARETDQLLANDRREAVRGKFVIEELIPDRIYTVLDSKTVLLIDDVLTSGNTMEECLRILKKGFPKTRFLPLVVAVKR